jgi:hypothetical protein
MITIRNLEDAYLNDLYRISLATGHMGGDASHLYTEADGADLLCPLRQMGAISRSGLRWTSEASPDLHLTLWTP